MIENTKPLCMIEVAEYIEKTEDGGANVQSFIKKFSKLKLSEAKKLREKIEEMKLLKMKDWHIAKILDILPEDEESLNKIFTEISLDEDESKKILELLKEFR